MFCDLNSKKFLDLSRKILKIYHVEHPRILVIRSGAIGDTIVMSVVYQALRRHFPQVYIEALGAAERLHLINTAGLIDKITSLELPGIAALFTENSPLSPQLMAYLQRFDLILLYSFARSGFKTLCQFHRQIYRFDPFPPNATNVHITTYLLNTLHVLGIDAHNLRPQIAVPEASQPSSPVSSRRIAIHSGSGSKSKNWGVDNFIELCRRVFETYQAEIMLIAGPAEYELVQDISSRLAGCLLTIIEKRPLPEIAAALRGCALYIGNDSGISHMAAAVGTPTIVIFGPSNPHIWRPLGRQVIVLYDESRRDCNSISVEQVLAEVGKNLQRKS